MGPKKLSTIRQELEQALTRADQDAIQWLEAQVRAAKSQHVGSAGTGNQVLDSLRRLLEVTPGKARRRPSRVSGQ
jgi:hypothetical protein